MARKPIRKPAVRQSGNEPDTLVGDLRLIARLLGLAVVKGRPMGEQAGVLAAAGFAPSEIAEMLGTTSASARQQIYLWRKSNGDRKKPSRE